MSIKNKLLLAESLVLAAVGGLLYLSRKDNEDWMKRRDNSQKYYDTTYRWMLNEAEGMRVENLLRDRGMQSVAIYGYGKLGELLYRKLKDSEITVSYIADVNKLLGLDPEISVPTYTPDRMRDAPETDAIIVTAINDYDTIVNRIREQGVDAKCISLDGLVMNSLS